ncbi:uncharacterized protein CC84DRAFT_1088440, partial [Paraphaeosphaeria sporulosa]
MDVESPELRGYPYKPLKSLSDIRVISLLPARTYNTRLEIRLTDVNRFDILLGSADTPSYEAVSYCWGEPNLSHTLVCDGQWTLGITANVDTMLRTLRKQNKTRYLWIDAICLNQKDNEEKRVQVGLMGDIFSEAAKVHIWLGEGEDDAIKKIFTAMRYIDARRTVRPGGIGDYSVFVLNSMCGKDSVRIFNAFFARPWFTRRWILQEAALGRNKTVRCGRHKISWSTFVNAVHRLSHSNPPFPTLRIRFKSTLDHIGTYDSVQENDLLPFLWDFDEADCVMPHDRIYALYGMINFERPFSLPEVDYSKPWPAVFMEIAQIYYHDTSRWKMHGASILQHLISFGSLASTDP